ncbi:MAG: FHA domain-containing protein, partial [Candidatus Promineifilaceae bacterium]
PRPLAAQEREEQAPAAAGLAYLEALAHAPEHPRPIPLDGANLALGRDYNRSQITFGDASVARLHARILANGWAYRIQDEASETGTYVNFERLGMASRPLADGDHIHLGRVHLRFRQPAARGA